MYRHIASGFIFALPRSGAIEVAGQQIGPHTSEAALLALGCEVYVEPPAAIPEPVVLSIDEQRAQALDLYHEQASECLHASLPSPWDILRDVATPEFQAWADAFMELAAAELSRLEAAVAASQSAEDLAAIVADWPEVTP